MLSSSLWPTCRHWNTRLLLLLLLQSPCRPLMSLPASFSLTCLFLHTFHRAASPANLSISMPLTLLHPVLVLVLILVSSTRSSSHSGPGLLVEIWYWSCLLFLVLVSTSGTTSCFYFWFWFWILLLVVILVLGSSSRSSSCFGPDFLFKISCWPFFLFLVLFDSLSRFIVFGSGF